MSTNTVLHFRCGNLQEFIRGIYSVRVMRKKFICLIVACFMISTVTLNVSADNSKDIPTNASETGIHESLVAALTHADLVSTLQGDGPFTVFAPTDQAFTDAGIDLSTFDTDEENATLVDILTYHVVSGKLMASDVVNALKSGNGKVDLTALNGQTITAISKDGKIYLEDSQGNMSEIIATDVAGSNGVIHVISSVVMPE